MNLFSDFNYPDILGRAIQQVTASIKFLECIQDCFLIQLLDVLTKNEARLDLLPTNQGSLLCNISLSDSFGCSDCNIVESGAWLCTLKVNIKAKENVTERILLRAIRSQMKHMIRKCQHGFTEAKLCLTNLIAL